MDAKLVMFKRDGQRKEFPIQHKSTVIGRGEECGLRIPLLSVSSRHCEVIKGENELRIRDLASSNGTYVNNRRVNETVLRAGDRLVIGPVVLTLQVDGQPQEIRPVKSKTEKVSQTKAAPVSEAPAEAGEDEVIELEADITSAADTEPAGAEDPLAALEQALTEKPKPQQQPPKKGKK